MKGETGSLVAPQTEPGWQVPSVRSNAESPVVKPAPGASGSSATSCPGCCSGSSSGALLALPLSSAGLCKEKVKTQPSASSSINTWPCHIDLLPRDPSSFQPSAKLPCPSATTGDWMLNPRP